MYMAEEFKLEEVFPFSFYDPIKVNNVDEDEKDTSPSRRVTFSSGFAPMILNNLNKDGFDIYFAVNEYKETKCRDKSQFKAAHAVWLDIDGYKPGVELPEFPIQPSLVIKTSPGSYHIYWRTYCDSQAEHAAVLRGMVDKYNGDPKAMSAGQILRAPGFVNHKHGNLVEVVEYNKSLVYDWADIIAAFPPVDAPEPRVNSKGYADRWEATEAISEIYSGADGFHDNLIRVACSMASNNVPPKIIKAILRDMMVHSEAGKKRISRELAKLDQTVDSAVVLVSNERNDIIHSSTDWDLMKSDLPYPPGATGDLVRDIERSMPYPSKEIAIAVAFHCISVIGCGLYHINGVPVNRKRIILAENGRGKQTTSDYFSRLLYGINIPNMDRFVCADAYGSSKLLEQINEHRVKSLIVNESGFSSSSMAGDKEGKLAFLHQAVSSKFGGAKLSDKAYSSRTKTAVDIKPVANPVLVIMEESTPQTYIKGFKEDKSTESGMLARSEVFFIGVEEYYNEDSMYYQQPTEDIRARFHALAKQFISVGVEDGTETDGTFYDKFVAADVSQVAQELIKRKKDNVLLRQKADNVGDSLGRAILVRREEKLLATMLAIAVYNQVDINSDSTFVPVITPEILEYAAKYHECLDRTLQLQFEKGYMASTVEQLKSKIEKNLERCGTKDDPYRAKLTQDGYITNSWLALVVKKSDVLLEKFMQLTRTHDHKHARMDLMNMCIQEGIVEPVPGRKNTFRSLISRKED